MIERNDLRKAENRLCHLVILSEEIRLAFARGFFHLEEAAVSFLAPSLRIVLFWVPVGPVRETIIVPKVVHLQFLEIDSIPSVK